jgi:alkanesulfonate monooxygenase SsuD/methylene tetrahydromethanopterin reductase-like flavin-dependent oxidoreductase (luciferase family)
MGDTMEYGITLPRTGVAERPSPLKYLTHFAREAEQMGYAYAVVGDRLEGGIDPVSILTAIVEASGRMHRQSAALEGRWGQRAVPRPPWTGPPRANAYLYA